MLDHHELVEPLRHAVSAVILVANNRDIYELPRVGYQVFWLDPTDDARASGNQEEREEHSYRILTEQIGEKIEKDSDVQRLLAICEEFKNREGKAFPAFGVTMMAGGEDLLREYFERIGQLKLDDRFLDEVCAEYIEDLRAANAWVRSVYWVQNFSAPAEFSLDNEVTFRPITAQDIDTFGRLPSSSLMETALWLNSEDWVCEIQQLSPKDTMQVLNEQPKIIDQISVALNLVKEGRANFQLLERGVQSPFLHVGKISGSQPIASSGDGGKLGLDGADVRDIKSIYDKVKRIPTDPSYRHLRLPYRRLRDAASRRQREDILVDHVIGLESLLGGDSERLETTYRFRLRGAALLPDSFGEARERIKLMSDLYDLRSKVVHGGSLEIPEMLPKAENVLRTILRFYLDNVDTVGNTNEIIRKLDEAMVSGGQSWYEAL